MNPHRHSPYTHNLTNGRTRANHTPRTSNRPTSDGRSSSSASSSTTEHLSDRLQGLWTAVCEQHGMPTPQMPSSQFNNKAKTPSPSKTKESNNANRFTPQSPRYIKEEYTEDITEPKYTPEHPIGHDEAFYKLLVAQNRDTIIKADLEGKLDISIPPQRVNRQPPHIPHADLELSDLEKSTNYFTHCIIPSEYPNTFFPPDTLRALCTNYTPDRAAFEPVIDSTRAPPKDPSTAHRKDPQLDATRFGREAASSIFRETDVESCLGLIKEAATNLEALTESHRHKNNAGMAAHYNRECRLALNRFWIVLAKETSRKNISYFRLLRFSPTERLCAISMLELTLSGITEQVDRLLPHAYKECMQHAVAALRGFIPVIIPSHDITTLFKQMDKP